MIGRIEKLIDRAIINPAYQYGMLAVIMLFAAALRFYKLGEWSFWIDEIFTINRASIHVNLDTIIAQWWHPSISLILSKVAIDQFGLSEWSARLVPATIGIISIPILYFPIKRLFGPIVALIAILLLAVAPWHLEWSQNARYYSSLLLLYFLAAVVFYLAMERDRPIFFLLAGLLLVLAIGERFLAIMLIPVILCYLALLLFLPFEKPPGFNVRNLALILVPSIMFVFIEIVRFLRTGSSYITGAADLVYSLPIDDPFRLAGFIVFNIGIALICLALFGGVYLILQRSRAGLFVMLNAVVPVVLLLMINPFYFTQAHYVFMVLPFWIILAAVAVKVIYDSTEGSAVIIAIGVLMLLFADAMGDNLLYYQSNHGNRRDWKSAFALVQEQSLPEDQIVTWWPEFGPYYLDKEIISWGDVDPGYVMESGQRFWFVLDEETVWGNPEMKGWIEENGELIDIKYLRRPGEAYLLIYLYDPDE